MNTLRFGLPLLVVIALASACSSSSDAADDSPLPSSDAGVLDSGSTSDASTDDAGPIDAPADTWTWVDVPGSKCANGSQTGFAVNPHAGTENLVVYFEGGGGCASADSCWGANPSATNLNGYDATTFAAAKQTKYPALDRTLASNPLKDMSFAYVPYCTGDLHAGTSEVDLATDGGAPKPTSFWGAKDLDLFLARIVPTFASTNHVWLLGTSAGGFATFLDYDKVAHAFPGVRVDVIDDSGPPVEHKTGGDTAFTTWGITAPAGCSTCTTYRGFFDFDRQSRPETTFAFLSFTEDSTISLFFGYTPAEFEPVVTGFSSSIASDPHAKTFLVTNAKDHVVESDLTLTSEVLPWIGQAVTDDPGWTDVTYAHP
ncbi:MAG TPA: pectin acetylesterase-family hydrolase [Polyangiaceae bacterium]